MPSTIPVSVRTAIPGSFRDPSGYVFEQDGVLYRQVNAGYREHYDCLVGSGLAADLIKDGLLIAHDEVPTTPADREAYRVIRPERVPFISYPYEWSFSQLRDAALLTLRVHRRALHAGMILKDASAYNVQFLNGRPVFIDTLSFEKYIEGQPWQGYRQFCQHFLGPLALMAYRDVRLSQLHRVFIDGVPLDLTSTLLPARTRLMPSLAAHLHLHARAQQTYAGQSAPASRRPRIRRNGLVALAESLAAAIRRLRWRPEGTEWGEYYSDTNYTEDALAEKERLVARMLDSVRPRVVWDLGANVGRFSRITSRKHILTIAFDLDPAAVEKNYLECSASGDTHLLPLVLDLTNPSPGLGWDGDERLAIHRRGPADVALALALIHHLAIGNNLPFEKIAQFLARVCGQLIVEFVPKDDSQVQRLLSSRSDIFDRYTQSHFLRAFEQHFDVILTEPIRGTQRVLFLMRRRGV